MAFRGRFRKQWIKPAQFEQSNKNVQLEYQKILNIEYMFNQDDLIVETKYIDLYDYNIKIEREGIGICGICNEQTYVFEMNSGLVRCLKSNCIHHDEGEQPSCDQRFDILCQVGKTREQNRQTLELLKTETIELMGIGPFQEIFNSLLRFYV